MNKTKLIGQEEFTYCNVCTRYTEIVEYRENIDLALCAKCKNNHKAIVDYLIESIADFN
jgi:hypothetical protein